MIGGSASRAGERSAGRPAHEGPASGATPVLSCAGVSLAFGGLKAVSDFSLALGRGTLHGLIGPNGAGKTTVFNLLTGVYRPDAGRIELAGVRLDGLRPSRIAAAGLSRTFQNIRLFRDMTVLDNVRLGLHLRSREGMLKAVLRTPGALRQEQAMLRQASTILAALGFAGRHDELARNLPYGDQRRLEIARALATAPKVLCLDEPAAGMNPQEKLALRELIRSLRDRFDLTILLIEHDMGLVMGLCERITVLDHGVTIAEGPPAAVQGDPRVIEAYLGVDVSSGDATTAAAAPDRADGSSRTPSPGGAAHGAA